MRTERYFLASMFFCLWALAGCGGGGGQGTASSSSSVAAAALPSGSLPASPVVAVSAATKHLKFSWQTAAGATSYRLMRNPDGVSGFSQVGADLPANSTAITVSVSVHQFDWVNARFMVAACNGNGCTNSAVKNPGAVMLDAIGYVKSSNPDVHDEFGNVVALSGDGNTLAVASLQEDSGSTGIDGNQSDNSQTGAGAVYIFVRAAGVWVQQAYVKASNTLSLNYFGKSLAMNFDGSVLVVGAPNETGQSPGVDGNQDQTGMPKTDSGAVYVFRRTGQVWAQRAYLKASLPKGSMINPPYILTLGAVFGSSVAVDASGDTIAVGAYGDNSAATTINGDESDTGAESAGAVYVFSSTGPSWVQQAYIKASNTEAGDLFGYSIALSGDGNTLAVSSMFEDSSGYGTNADQSNNDMLGSGAVYVFSRSAGRWSQQQYLKASNPGEDDRFGYSVSLSHDGNVLAVGALNESSDSAGINGAQGNDNSPQSGAVYLFGRSGSNWAQTTYIKPSANSFMNFGSSVALSADGALLAVAAREEGGLESGINGNQYHLNVGSRTGAVYVYKQSAGVWSQKSYVKASNAGSGDTFGWSLALSSDGSVMAVGARSEDSRSSGINGDQFDDVDEDDDYGAVYLY